MEDGNNFLKDQASEKIVHDGKEYSKIKIEGLGEESDYLVDEKGDVYAQDFKYVTNIGENIMVQE